jgi:hypothetical protein
MVMRLPLLSAQAIVGLWLVVTSPGLGHCDARTYYNVPKSQWKTLGEEDRSSAVKAYFSSRAIVVYALSLPKEKDLLWNVELRREEPNGKLRTYDAITGCTLVDDKSRWWPKEQHQLWGVGVCLFKVQPGRHRLSICPGGDNPYPQNDSCHVWFDVEPGQIVDLGEFRVDCKVVRGTGKRYPSPYIAFDVLKSVSEWGCTRTESLRAVDGLLAAYPEIYGALKESIVRK